MYSKFQPKKNATLCKERMRSQLDMDYLDGTQDNGLYPTSETRRQSRLDDLLWAPVDGNGTVPHYPPDCVYCRETAAVGQFGHYPCEQLAPPFPPPRDYERHSAATQMDYGHSGCERQQRHKRRETPMECDCPQRSNNTWEQHFAPLPTRYEKPTSYEPTAPPADELSSPSKRAACPVPLSTYDDPMPCQRSYFNDQKTYRKQTTNQVTQTTEEYIDDHDVPRHHHARHHHITREPTPPADGPNRSHHKHGRNRHVQLPSEDQLPKRADKLPRDGPFLTPGHNYEPAEDRLRKHGHAHKTSHDDYLVLYKNDNFDNESSVERIRKPDNLADVRPECKKQRNAIRKPSETPFVNRPMNENIYDLYNSDSNGTNALHLSTISESTGRQAMLQGSGSGGAKVIIGSPTHLKHRIEPEKRAGISAPTLSNATGFSLSAEDIIDAKVTAPMIRRVQRIYRTNLAEQMMLVRELGSIPRLVREILEQIFKD